MKHFCVLTSPLVVVFLLILLSSPVAQAANGGECDAHGEGCPADRFCVIESEPRKCKKKREIGEKCNRDEKCLSGKCLSGSCAEGDSPDSPESPDSPDDPTDPTDPIDPCNGVECDDKDYCFEGQCIKKDKCFGVVCDDDQFCRQGKCERKRPDDRPCNANYKCISGYCDDESNQCAPCPRGLTCPPPPGRECNNNFDCALFGLLEYCEFVDGNCQPYRTVGERCQDDFQCFSGYCSPFEFPRRCRNRRALGRSCDFDEQCQSRSCDNQYEECKYLFLFAWDCSTNTCVPGVAEGREGDYCTKNYQCQQDKCARNDNVCKENLLFKGPDDGLFD